MTTAPINLSPWAQRFGPYPKRWNVDRHGKYHSLLAPRLPDIDPQYTNDIPGIDIPLPGVNAEGQIPRPSDTELDALFDDERYQQIMLHGIKSRQLGLLSTNTYLGKSGHTHLSGPDGAGDNAGGTPIQVDESTWLPCMQRNRWYKPQERTNVPFPHVQDWSIDDDNIWSMLMPIFELANRIMNLLVEERHSYFDMLLFGAIWLEEKEPSLPQQPGKYRQLQPSENPPQTKDRKRIFIRERPMWQRPNVATFRTTLSQLTRNVMWSWNDEDDYRAAGYTAPEGSTQICNLGKPIDQNGPILILLSTQPLRGLIERTLTHSESGTVSWHAAGTILHELMHAIWMQRTWSGHFITEPFLGHDGMAELGRSFENVVWGGISFMMHQNVLNFNRTFHSRAIGSRLDDWPNIFDVQSYSGSGQQRRAVAGWRETAQSGDGVVSWHIPARWTTFMFTKEFWDILVPAYGLRALRPPKVVSGVVVQWRSRLRGFRINARDPVNEMKQLGPYLRFLKNRLYDREQQINSLRPWQTVEYDKWQVSPWSWTAARILIKDYAMFHAQRNYRQAAHSAMALYAATVEAFNLDVGVPGGYPQLTATYWHYYIISGLMYAALPMVPPLPAKHSKVTVRVVVPTQHANSVHPAKSPDCLKKQPLIPNEVHYLVGPKAEAFQITQPSEFLASGPIKHPLEYIQHIYDLFTKLKQNGYPFHGDWYNAALQAIKDIQNFRKTDQIPHSWADWTFQVPDYNADADRWMEFSPSQNVFRRYTAGIDKFARGFFPSPPQVLPPIQAPVAQVPHGVVSLQPQGQAPASFFQGQAPSSGPPGPTTMATGPKKKSPYLQYHYFTVASVADISHWVVDPNPDDETFDVYDLEALLDGLNYDNVETKNVTVCGPKGRQLRPEYTKLREELRKPGMRCRVGKLLPWYRREELAEFDGSKNMPSWVAMADAIFDITEYLPKDAETQKWLNGSAGGPLRPDTQERLDCISEILSSPQVRNIGIVMPGPCKTAAREPSYLIPKSRLRHYDNPTDGLYTVINGHVYDVADYMDFHPGGTKLFNAVLGRDGTKAFEEYHPLSLLERPDFAKFKVGRVMKTRRSGHVRDDEIALHDLVFTVRDLEHQDPFLYDMLSPFYGTDSTHILTSDKQEDEEIRDALTTFYLHRKDLIVAQFQMRKRLRKVDLDEVKKHRYISTSIVPCGTQDPWVVVDDNVYDVTPLLRHPQFYDPNSGLTTRDAGEVISGSRTGRWLRSEHGHRIIAKVKTPRHDSVSTMDLDAFEESLDGDTGKKRKAGNEQVHRSLAAETKATRAAAKRQKGSGGSRVGGPGCPRVG
ncbi:hypothetical protein BKA67DRAFT_660758 [Truncatella angustata]|uniref:Cytochrome b5 heme-binding domain-containing protein n=1 Tax=Truncatella angustata TaxID=152316 RepID=A0A9P8UGX6_9PEZI|nr:uncharacterized protein BKA67DRAFT_660758 [Truncatella angustata]KAH6651985.1 hypothetical protein BKA67DRAFT_660758 [Truncatella angustata]